MEPNHKKKEIIMWICVYPDWRMNFDYKKLQEVKSFLWNGASISFMKKRMSLWCPIRKEKEIIPWIRVYPNWQMKFDSKKWWKFSFSCETKESIHLCRMSLWCQIMERKKIIMLIRVCPNRLTNFNSKKVESEVFLRNQSINITYPNEENMLMVPNHEKKTWICVYPNWRTNFDWKKW